MQAKREAERARSEALRAEGVVEDDSDETDEDVVMPSQFGAEFDETSIMFSGEVTSARGCL